jgi:dTDP-4-dehydrorhamnose reductase
MGSEILITGADGQVGRALADVFPDAVTAGHTQLDITDAGALRRFDWSKISCIINAAAYTNVDGAETPEGQKMAWAINDKGVGNLVDTAVENGLILVHISTAYVFDGTKKFYNENDEINPLGEYAKSKAAGDLQARKAGKHYIVRTDSVIGDGKNFVRPMLALARKGIAPTVVADQFMRPTFTTELSRAIKFLLEKPAQFGIYNLTNEGDPVSWADFTRAIFKEAGINLEVTNTTFREYSAGKPGVAPRPLNSLLDLAKIESAGFKPRDWRENLRQYIKKESDA